MKVVQRVAVAMGVVAVGIGVAASSALAVGQYNNWGPLYAYEGSTYVAAGKGTVGVDYNLDVIGGHMTQYDPRPGGSGAYAKAEITYFGTYPQANSYTRVRGNNNYTAAWVDQFKTKALDLNYSSAGLVPAACQDDSLGPDACKNDHQYNYKW